MFHFNTVEEALEDIKAGKMIIVTDDEDRENEGDLVAAAELCTPETINFMATYAKGLICLPLDLETANRLGFSQMVTDNTDPHGTAFTVSIDHIDTGTGISAHERALTTVACTSPTAKPSDFRRPGHIFPLVAKEHGVLKRPGHTEATVDLMTLSGLSPVGLCCEIMEEDGSMMKTPALMEFAKKHDLKFITIAHLIEYRRQHDYPIKKITETQLPTQFGTFTAHGFLDLLDGREHLALTMGDLSQKAPTLTRLHSECLTGDVFGSARCDCGNQLHKAMEQIAQAGRGALLYLRQEGRGIGLLNKLRAYHLQDGGLDTVEANHALGFPDDLRNYAVCAHMLSNLGIEDVCLMTNNPDKIEQLSRYGTHVSDRVPIVMQARETDKHYLQTKQEKMRHMLEF